MGKNLSLWMLGIAAMLASCSQSEDLLQGTESNGTNAVTLTVTLDGGMKTRAYTEDPTLDKMQLAGFLVEEPTDGTVSPVVSAITGITGDGANGYSVSISDLNEEKSYKLVFWASENGAYSIQDQTVTPVNASQPGIAFYGATENYKTPAQLAEDAQLTLTHAVAKVTLNTTTELTDGKIATLSVPTCASFNLISGEATGEETAIDTSEGSTSSDLCSVYVLCNDNDELPTATITLSNGQEKTISSLPMKRNNHIKLQGDVNGIGMAEDVVFTVELKEDWNEEPKTFPEAETNAVTSTITTYVAGQLAETPQLIADTINLSSKTKDPNDNQTYCNLNVVGPVNDADIRAINQWIMDQYGPEFVDPNIKLALDLSQTEGLTTLTREAFYYNDGYREALQRILHSIVLPSTITEVEYYAFGACVELTKVIFNSPVEAFGDHAFRGCSALAEIDLSNCTTPPTVGTDAFYGVNEDTKCIIYVNKEAASKFTGEPWDNFTITVKE